MSISRREFLQRAAACAAVSALAPHRLALAQPRFESYPFQLGIASGYPHPGGVTLWTRLAPRPLEGGGMPESPVEVGWELAADESFRTIAASGKALAVPQLAHSVH